MANIKKWCLVLALVLQGCAAMPKGPSIMVLPTPGKPFDLFVAEDNECRQWAARGVNPEEANRQTVAGAAVGTVIGAGAGAAIGAAAGNPGAGAAIGGGSGLLVGSASGYSAGEYYMSEEQRRYDITYVQCMYAKGNQVPGVVSHSVKKSRIRPPPPPSAPKPDKSEGPAQ